jgi:hypothetical protein
MDHAQHRSDRELAANLEPRLKPLPRPAVHPDLATLSTLPAANEHRAPRAIEIALMQRQRFADPQASAPKQDDQRAEAMTLGAVTDRTHYRDDLLNGRRVRRVVLTLVAGGGLGGSRA